MFSMSVGCHHLPLICATGVVVEVAMEAERGAGIIIEMGLGLTEITLVEIKTPEGLFATGPNPRG